jgi:hypothetical protein
MTEVIYHSAKQALQIAVLYMPTYPQFGRKRRPREWQLCGPSDGQPIVDRLGPIMPPCTLVGPAVIKSTRPPTAVRPLQNDGWEDAATTSRDTLKSLGTVPFTTQRIL